MGAILCPVLLRIGNIIRGVAMYVKKRRQSTMIVGLVEIPALPHSNLDIIHKIASGLDIDGYTVRRISIFEDPLIANIHIETNSFTHCNKSMSLFPKKTRLIDISQSLYICLLYTSPSPRD